jgi:hypothetical protein
VGLPLFLAQQLLYAGACAALVRAVRPALASAAGRFGLYALLLVNPMSYDTSSLGRILRQHLQVPLVLLVLAALMALLLRRARPLRQNLGWCLLLGFAWGGFYLTREDDAFLLPSLALLGGAWFWLAWREGAARLASALSCAGMMLAAAVLPILAVSAQNYRHYGWFGTVEFRAAAFQDAYGALARLRVGPEHPHVFVSREACEAAYAASPAFAALRPQLAGAIGLGWAESSSAWTGLPPADRQIGGGWFMWALRDAVAASGHAPSARSALACYRRMADEINAACAERPPAPPARGAAASGRTCSPASLARSCGRRGSSPASPPGSASSARCRHATRARRRSCSSSATSRASASRRPRAPSIPSSGSMNTCTTSAQPPA